MARKTLFMETTGIDAMKTVGEIHALLVAAGAVAIQNTYEAGRIVGLEWAMNFGPGQLRYKMPARVEPIFQILRKSHPAWSIGPAREQAERVAWRQLLRWIQAQLAMAETGMVQPAEIFLPYMLHGRSGQTFFEYFQTHQLALPAPEGEKNA